MLKTCSPDAISASDQLRALLATQEMWHCCADLQEPGNCSCAGQAVKALPSNTLKSHNQCCLHTQHVLRLVYCRSCDAGHVMLHMLTFSSKAHGHMLPSLCSKTDSWCKQSATARKVRLQADALHVTALQLSKAAWGEHLLASALATSQMIKCSKM